MEVESYSKKVLNHLQTVVALKQFKRMARTMLVLRRSLNFTEFSKKLLKFLLKYKYSPLYLFFRYGVLKFMERNQLWTRLKDNTDLISGYVAFDHRPGANIHDPLPHMGRICELMVCLERTHPHFPILGSRTLDGDLIAPDYAWVETDHLRHLVHAIAMDIHQIVKEDIRVEKRQRFWIAPSNEQQRVHVDPRQLSPKYTVIIMMDNCLYLFAVILAVLKTQCTALFLHPDMTEELILKALEGTTTRMAFVSSKYLNLFANLNYQPLTMIVSSTMAATRPGLEIFTWEAYLKRCSFHNINEAIFRPFRNTLALVSYTSCTSVETPDSEPRSGTESGLSASKITHEKLIDSIDCLLERKLPLSKGDVYFAAMPLGQIDQLILALAMMCRGIKVALSTYKDPEDNESTIDSCFDVKDAHCAKPDLLFATPSILNRLYKEILQSMMINRSDLYVKCFLKLVRWNATLLSNNIPCLDWMFIRPNRKYFTNLKLIISAGDILAPSIQDFFRGYYGLNVIQYYNCSETGYITLMQDYRDFSVDTVGYPFKRILFKFGEQGTEGPLNKPPSGLLYLSTPEHCLTYRSVEPEDQPQCGSRIWLDTPDVARLKQDGAISIVEYKRDICPSLGQPLPSIPLSRLEALYRSSFYIEDIAIFACSDKLEVVAVVLPNRNSLNILADRLKLEGERTLEALTTIKEMKYAIELEFQTLAKKSNLSELMIPQEILLASEWPRVTSSRNQKKMKIFKMHEESIVNMSGIVD